MKDALIICAILSLFVIQASAAHAFRLTDDAGVWWEGDYYFEINSTFILTIRYSASTPSPVLYELNAPFTRKNLEGIRVPGQKTKYNETDQIQTYNLSSRCYANSSISYSNVTVTRLHEFICGYYIVIPRSYNIPFKYPFEVSREIYKTEPELHPSSRMPRSKSFETRQFVKENDIANTMKLMDTQCSTRSFSSGFNLWDLYVDLGRYSSYDYGRRIIWKCRGSNEVSEQLLNGDGKCVKLPQIPRFVLLNRESCRAVFAAYLNAGGAIYAAEIYDRSRGDPALLLNYSGIKSEAMYITGGIMSVISCIVIIAFAACRRKPAMPMPIQQQPVYQMAQY